MSFACVGGAGVTIGRRSVRSSVADALFCCPAAGLFPEWLTEFPERKAAPFPPEDAAGVLFTRGVFPLVLPVGG